MTSVWPPNYPSGPMIRIGDIVQGHGHRLLGADGVDLIWSDLTDAVYGSVQAIEADGVRVRDDTEGPAQFLCGFDQLVKINLPTTVTLPPLMGERFLRCVDRCMTEWLGDGEETHVLAEVADLVRAAMGGQDDDESQPDSA